ncbi:MAG: SMC family ATPase [archaeon]
MIESITLENWKTHRSSTLRFRKGTNVLVGVIGSGKSSVMDGLCYALFGTFPALQNRRVSSADLLMRKPFSADQARVEVCFSIKDTPYRVERILKRNGSNEGRLYMGGSLIAGPKPNQVTERVEKELQVSYELFARAVYSEQNQVDYFLKLNPGDRKKKFDELLDLQKYEVVRGNVNQLVNHFRKSTDSVTQSLAQFEAVLQSQDLNELRFKREGQKQKRLRVEAHLSGKKQEKERLGQERIHIQDQVAKVEKWQQSVQSQKGQLQTIHSRLDVFSKQHPNWDAMGVDFAVTEKKSIAERIRLLQSKQEQHRLLDVQRQKAVQRLDLIEKRKKDWESKTEGVSIVNIEARISEMKKQKAQLQEKWNTLNGDYTECVSLVRLSDAQLVEVENEVRSLHSLHANCPTCKQEIHSSHKENLLSLLAAKRQGVESQRAAAEARRSSLHSERMGIELVVKGLDPVLVEQESLRMRIQEGSSLLAEVDKAKLELENAEKAMAVMGQPISDGDLDALRTQGVHVDKCIELFSVKKESDRLGALVDEGEKNLAGFGDVRGRLDVINAEWSRFESEWNALERERELLVQVEGELVERLKSVESLVAQVESLTMKRGQYSSIVEGLGVFSTALMVTQQQLREGVVEAINAALVELWPALYPYSDFSLAKLLVQDNDYVLSVREQRGDWVVAESSLSGGERSSAALALRMAVAFVLTRQLSWIILDEPTHNLDAKSVHSLSRMLRDRLPGLVDQVFVITHSPEIEKAATGSLYVLERDKDVDGPTSPVNKPIDLGTRAE